jgi:hypothetical protein
MTDAFSINLPPGDWHDFLTRLGYEKTKVPLMDIKSLPIVPRTSTLQIYSNYKYSTNSQNHDV